jgi:hypothetical protein
MRDDLVHVPAGHLTSYRPLFFADLWLWNHLFGPDYLQTIVPKLLGGIWTVLLALLTANILRRRSSSVVVYAGIPLLFLSHPIVNELTLFNVMVPAMLSMLLAVLAFVVIEKQLTLRRGAAATLLLAGSISGYQINLTVFALLVVFAATADVVSGRAASVKRLMLSAAVLASAVLLYLGYVAASVHLMGIRSWGARGLIAPEGFRLAEVVHVKWHGATNMLAGVTQPGLSWFLSAEAAWRMWSIPFAVLGLLFVAGVAWRRRLSAAAWASLGFLLLLAIPPAILFTMNVTPEGWRVDGPALYAFALVIALAALAWESNNAVARATMTASLVVLIGISMFLTRWDAGLRAEAAHRDEDTLRVIRSRYAAQVRGAAPRVFISPVSTTAVPPAPIRPDERHFLMAEFHRVTWLDYSNLWPGWSFPEAYLRAHGIAVSAPDGAAAQACGATPLRRGIVFDDASRRVFLCR